MPFEIIETIKMIQQENLDIRTITMGISLRDCACSSGKESRKKIYDKITRLAENLVKVGEDIEREYGVPIVNKRIPLPRFPLLQKAAMMRIMWSLPKLWTEPPTLLVLILSAVFPHWFTRDIL